MTPSSFDRDEFNIKVDFVVLPEAHQIITQVVGTCCAGHNTAFILSTMADESKHDFLGRPDVDTIGDFLKRHELADDAVDMVQDRTTLFNSDAHSDLPVFYITACDVAVQDYLSAGHPLREAADRAGAITAAAQTTKKAPNRHGKDASQLHSSSSTFGRNPRSRSKPKRSARLHANEVPLALQHHAFRTFRETVTAGLDAVPIDFVATVEALADNAVNKLDTEGKREDAVHPRLSDVLTWGTAGDVLAFKGEQTSEVKTAVTVTAAAGKQHKVVAAGFRTDAHVGTSAVVARSCIRPAPSLTQCRPYAAINATRAAHATGGHVLAYVETKNELSSSGSAMDQLSAYYFQHVAWNHGKQGDMPLFLVAVSGPFIQVSGGLTRSHPQYSSARATDLQPRRFRKVRSARVATATTTTPPTATAAAAAPPVAAGGAGAPRGVRTAGVHPAAP